MKKYKLIIREKPHGTSIMLYKKLLFLWVPQDGYKPLSSALYLIDEFKERCVKIYGNKLIIDDRRFK